MFQQPPLIPPSQTPPTLKSVPETQPTPPAYSTRRKRNHKKKSRINIAPSFGYFRLCFYVSFFKFKLCNRFFSNVTFFYLN
uniref:Uncharacterized protein n=1 Tax=Helianthus annuus TaxID=4232 RepID=A0A251S1N6_HELAN